MKIYILRHEKRDEKIDFFTSLNSEGIENSKVLADCLMKLNIDEIYCSPYKRIIQTIEPYLKKSNKKINIENSLYECLTNNKDKRNIIDSSKSIIYGSNYINKNYNSFLYIDEVILGENYDYIKKRTTEFLKSLINNIKNKDKNILLVSHMTPINALTGRDCHDNYRQGMVTKIYDSDSILPICFSTLN